MPSNQDAINTLIERLKISSIDEYIEIKTMKGNYQNIQEFIDSEEDFEDIELYKPEDYEYWATEEWLDNDDFVKEPYGSGTDEWYHVDNCTYCVGGIYGEGSYLSNQYNFFTPADGDGCDWYEDSHYSWRHMYKAYDTEEWYLSTDTLTYCDDIEEYVSENAQVHYVIDRECYYYSDSDLIYRDGDYYLDPRGSLASYHSNIGRCKAYSKEKSNLYFGIEIETYMSGYNFDKLTEQDPEDFWADNGFVPESDSSLHEEYSVEFISDIISVNEMTKFKSQLNYIFNEFQLNPEGIKKSYGGHITVSVPETTIKPNKIYRNGESVDASTNEVLSKRISNFVPFLCGMYPSRAENSYCVPKPIGFITSDKYSAIHTKSDCVEIRIFPTPKTAEIAIWRIKLLQYVSEYNSLEELLKAMCRKSTRLHKHILKQYTAEEWLATWIRSIEIYETKCQWKRYQFYKMEDYLYTWYRKFCNNKETLYLSKIQYIKNLIIKVREEQNNQQQETESEQQPSYTTTREARQFRPRN
jgi:hypothetical protein